MSAPRKSNGPSEINRGVVGVVLVEVGGGCYTDVSLTSTWDSDAWDTTSRWAGEQCLGTHEFVKWCIEEDVSVSCVCGQELEWSVSRSDYRDSAFDDGFTVEISEVVLFAKCRKLCLHVREQSLAISLEVNEKNERLGRILIKDPVYPFVAFVVFRGGVLVIQDAD